MIPSPQTPKPRKWLLSRLRSREDEPSRRVSINLRGQERGLRGLVLLNRTALSLQIFFAFAFGTPLHIADGQKLEKLFNFS